VSDRISITVPDGLGALVEGLVRESGTTGEVPTLSKARAFRLLASDAADRLVEGDLDIHGRDLADEVDGETLAELLPDHVRARYLREEVKGKNWLADMKGGFEGRVRDALAERFKNGYDPDAAREVAEGYIDEARIYWLVIDDDPETFEEKREYVLDRIEQYRAKHETTTWDFEDEWLSGFSGVEQGEAEDEIKGVAGTIEAVAEQKVEQGASTDAIVDAVAFTFDVGREQVREIVEDVRRRKVIADQQSGGNGSVGMAVEDGTGRAHPAMGRSPDPDDADDLGSDRVLDEDEVALHVGGESDD